MTATQRQDDTRRRDERISASSSPAYGADPTAQAGHDGDEAPTGSFPVITPGADEGHGHAAGEHDPRHRLGMVLSWLLILVLCAGLGFGFVVQQRSVQSNYSSLSESELVRLLDETNRQITQLESQKTTLANQLTSIQESADKQRQIQKVAKENEEASGILAGNVPAEQRASK